MSDPVWPAPGDESAEHEPFTAYEVGSPKDVIQLSPSQQAAIQAAQAKDHTDWQKVNNAYAAAAAERAHGAAAHAAGNQLNAGDLASEGVIR